MHINHRLVAIRPIYGGRIKLTFRKTVSRDGVITDTRFRKTVISKKNSLCELGGMLCRTLCLSETFLMLQNRFWHQKYFLDTPSELWKIFGANFSHALTDLTIRQTYDWKVSKTSGRAVLLASYTDQSGTVFWDRVKGQGKVVGGCRYITDVTDEVIKHVHINLAELYQVDIRKIPYPIDEAMFVFNSYTFNVGWYT
ncbi:hypothetical protein KUTeg_024468 [Tegillarca granosa]|uniref:Uncharacterized protein n=1 Tax=Tegillarca granosa TaxID=220873 RepID=A0ABQ9DY50_TEGGR|nr:hypothetical protein KUTeg_024468 [Tegillarca granosa]